MKRTRDVRRWAPVLILTITLAAACTAPAAEKEAVTSNAVVEAVEGATTSQVTLTKNAARRLGVETEAVTAISALGTQVPYGAVFYDPKGATWTFVKVEGRTFERRPITVERVEGDVAFLVNGPAAGTEVVTVGGAEIYGAELGVGDDE